MRRRGRHRKSDAAIDAAIFSMLLSDRNLSSMAVHREMLKNPRYSLSERTLRRRMNEFLEFQRARSVCGDNVDDPVLTMSDPSQVQVCLVYFIRFMFLLQRRTYARLSSFFEIKTSEHGFLLVSSFVPLWSLLRH